jgi:non-ribosomal peptide synthetase component E (peptide arylation enzyme)
MRRLTEVSGPPVTELPQPTWIFDRIEEWAKRFPNRFAFAVDHQDRVEEYRYADVLREIAAVQETLTSKGIVPGDRIGILMENIPQWVFVLLGAMRSGVITVLLPTALPEPALRNIIQHAEWRIGKIRHIFPPRHLSPRLLSHGRLPGRSVVGRMKITFAYDKKAKQPHYQGAAWRH